MFHPNVIDAFCIQPMFTLSRGNSFARNDYTQDDRGSKDSGSNMSNVRKANSLDIFVFSRTTKIGAEDVFLIPNTRLLFNIYPVVRDSISISHLWCTFCMGYFVNPVKPTIAV